VTGIFESAGGESGETKFCRQKGLNEPFMRVRQKELRRTRKRLEERKKATAKGIAITGAGSAAAPVAQKISRPVSRRASETTPAPRPQNDRGGRGGDRRDDRGGYRDAAPPRDRRDGGDRPRRDNNAPRAERPNDGAPVAETTTPVVETTAAPETPATETAAPTAEA